MNMSIYKEFMYTCPYIISLMTMTGVVEDINGRQLYTPIIQTYAYEFLWMVINLIFLRSACYVAIKYHWKRRFQKFLDSPYLKDYDNPQQQKLSLIKNQSDAELWGKSKNRQSHEKYVEKIKHKRLKKRKRGDRDSESSSF